MIVEWVIYLLVLIWFYTDLRLLCRQSEYLSQSRLSCCRNRRQNAQNLCASSARYRTEACKKSDFSCCRHVAERLRPRARLLILILYKYIKKYYQLYYLHRVLKLEKKNLGDIYWEREKVRERKKRKKGQGPVFFRLITHSICNAYKRTISVEQFEGDGGFPADLILPGRYHIVSYRIRWGKD